MTAPIVAMSALADTLGLPLKAVQPLLEIHHRAAEHAEHEPDGLVVGDSAVGAGLDDVLHRGSPRAQRLVDVERDQPLNGHHSLLTLHGLSTRYVADVLLTARRWLQRSGWLRQAVDPRGLSDADTEGGA